MAPRKNSGFFVKTIWSKFTGRSQQAKENQSINPLHRSGSPERRGMLSLFAISGSSN
jgi:hypothetical protein